MGDVAADNPGASGNQGDAAASAAGAGSGTPQTGNAGDWFSSIPQEFQSEKSIQSFKGKPIGDVVKSFVEAQKLIGGSIRLPKPDASPEERKKFMDDLYGKIGRPASAKEYKYNLPQVPEEFGWSQDHLGKFAEKAHALGLSNEQLQGVLDFYGEYQNGMTPDYEKLQTEAKEALVKEFGKGADRKIAFAQRVLVTRGGKELVDLVERTGIGNHPVFIKLLAEFGEVAAEKGMIDGGQTSGMTLDQIQAEIDAAKNDPKSPYQDSKHKDHDKAVQRQNELYRMRQALRK